LTVASISVWPQRFQRPSGLVLEISVTAWSTMHHFQQHTADATEAGGVLVGRHLRDGSAIIVDQVTVPMPGDRRSRFRFYRDHLRHQECIDQAWHASEGTCTYLGEWHTHPQTIPIPSATDRADWYRRLRTDQFTEPLFFVIVGTIRTCIWEGYRRGDILPLTMLES
jgi:integrative and conjugative element protein (TIGR02256 family)